MRLRGRHAMATLIWAKSKIPMSYIIQSFFVNTPLPSPWYMLHALGSASGNQVMSCASNQKSQSISIPSGQWWPVQTQRAKTE